MENEGSKKSGSCLCGAVTFDVTGPLREIIMCHCNMCQKSSGHHYAATSAANDTLHIAENGALKWFKSSSHAERGFCGDCGCSLFWRMFDLDQTSIMMGSFDQDVVLPIASHLFVGEKKKYYTLQKGPTEYETYPKDS